MAHTIHWEPRGVWAQFHTEVTDDIAWEADNEVHADPRVEHIEYVIIDMRAARGTHMTEELVAGQAAVDLGTSYYIKPLRVALVAVEPVTRRVMSDYARACAAAGIRWEFEHFEDIKKAREWAYASTAGDA